MKVPSFWAGCRARRSAFPFPLVSVALEIALGAYFRHIARTKGRVTAMFATARKRSSGGSRTWMKERRHMSSANWRLGCTWHGKTPPVYELAPIPERSACP